MRKKLLFGATLGIALLFTSGAMTTLLAYILWKSGFLQSIPNADVVMLSKSFGIPNVLLSSSINFIIHLCIALLVIAVWRWIGRERRGKAQTSRPHKEPLS